MHASKDGNWTETQDESPTLTVAKANSPHETGRDVHITDSNGRRYGPTRFNEVLSFDRKPPRRAPSCNARPKRNLRPSA
jgi:hypothetical protein